MKFWETLYTAADNAGIPTTQIGPKLGMNRQYVATAKSKQNDIRLSTAIKLLRACDHALVAVPKTGQLPPDAIVIDTANDKQKDND